MGAVEEVVKGLIHGGASRAVGEISHVCKHVHDRQPPMHNLTGLHPKGVSGASSRRSYERPVDGIEDGVIPIIFIEAITAENMRSPFP